MAWWPSLRTNLNIHQDVLGSVDRTHLLSYSLVLMPISFLFSQELFQTGTPFPVQPDQHHLWTPSRRPYTVYLASPIVLTEPCHSSSIKGAHPWLDIHWRTEALKNMINCFDMIWIVSCKQISFDLIRFTQFRYCFMQRSQSTCIL